MASADFLISIRFPHGRHSPKAEVRTSQDKACYFPLVRIGYTHMAFSEISGFSANRHHTRHTCLISTYCTFRPRFAASFLQTPPYDDALALGFGVPFRHGPLGTSIPATRHA